MTRLRLSLNRCEELDCPAGLAGTPPDAPLALADLNRDGTPDVVAADPTDGEVRAWLRDPAAGTFADSFRAAAGLRAPTAVAVADLDFDGLPDLLVADGGADEVRVYAGRPGGTFAAAGAYPVGDAPAGLLVADVNGDAVPDVLTANEGSHDVSVLLGRTNAGRWSAEPGVRSPTGGFSPAALAVRDPKTDGRGDLVVYDRRADALAVLPALGGGRFRAEAAAVLALPPGGSTAPFVDPVTGAGFVADAGGAVFGFDLNDVAAGVRPALSVPLDAPVIGLTPVAGRAGAGVILATASGRVALAGQEAGGTYSFRRTATGPAGGRFVAAGAVRRATGFDVYLVPRGSGRPVVVTLDDVPSVGGGPTTGPTPVNPAAVRLSFDVVTSGNTLAPVPAVSPRPGASHVQPTAETRDARTEAPLEYVSAWSNPPDPPDPQSKEAEAVRGWERWYLDLDRLLREAVRPAASSAPKPPAEQPAVPYEPAAVPLPQGEAASGVGETVTPEPKAATEPAAGVVNRTAAVSLFWGARLVRALRIKGGNRSGDSLG